MLGKPHLTPAHSPALERALRETEPGMVEIGSLYVCRECRHWAQEQESGQGPLRSIYAAHGGQRGAVLNGSHLACRQ